MGLSIFITSLLAVLPILSATSSPSTTEFNVWFEACKHHDYFLERLGKDVYRIYPSWLNGLQACATEADLEHLAETTFYPVYCRILYYSDQVFAVKVLHGLVLQNIPSESLSSMSKVSKTWKQAVFAEMKRRYGAQMIDWKFLIEDLYRCCRAKSSSSTALVEFVKSVWPKPSTGYSSAFYLKAFECLEMHVSHRPGVIGTIPFLDLPVEYCDLAVHLKEREIINTYELIPVESISGHESAILSRDFHRFCSLDDIQWLVENGHRDSLKKIALHLELAALHNETTIPDHLRSQDVAKDILLACLTVSDDDRPALLAHLKALYKDAALPGRQSAIMDALVRSYLSLDEIVMITRKLPSIIRIFEYAPHFASQYIRSPEYMQGRMDIEGLVAEDFSGPLTDIAILEFTLMEVTLCALASNASDEAIKSLWKILLKDNTEFGNRILKYSPMNYLIPFAMHLKKSEELISFMLHHCDANDLENVLMRSNNIPSCYFQILCKAGGDLGRNYAGCLLRQSGKKPKSVRIESLETLISSMDQEQLISLAHDLSNNRHSKADPMVVYGFLEAMFIHWNGRACDLMDFDSSKESLELFFLGQTLDLLFFYSLLEFDNCGSKASKFCQLAMSSAIKKFGLEAVLIASENHSDKEKLHRLIKTHSK